MRHKLTLPPKAESNFGILFVFVSVSVYFCDTRRVLWRFLVETIEIWVFQKFKKGDSL